MVTLRNKGVSQEIVNDSSLVFTLSFGDKD